MYVIVLVLAVAGGVLAWKMRQAPGLWRHPINLMKAIGASLAWGGSAAVGIVVLVVLAHGVIHEVRHGGWFSW